MPFDAFRDLTVRQARPADYDAIVAVVDTWWGRPIKATLPRLYLEHFHATSRVAEHPDGSLAGFLIAFLSPSLAQEAYIHFVGVDPALRGSGLAGRLYREFFAEAAAAGRDVVRAVTSPVNHGSIAFHTAMGFSVTGPVDGYNGEGSSLMLFERRLEPTSGTR
ncbi:GNAT family N-acetyltransferase [Streptacidiphilus jiangxiensis]|uniref:L-amino acid N-acyltransferase YncA n=1 Tax=Streptacidiphilus jiangxiensis TaxID=235985 RepID=A0A1H7RJB9_STRJI|nr:GNAT family N-acetyltransferase [Streptacidiphilus jiangxiensis]SEL60293.1 L-amino acid N-acyltransferase YncA [Streptacidiphilus jiangxiensis]